MPLGMNEKARVNVGGDTYLEDSSTCIKISNGREQNVYGRLSTLLPVPWLFSVQQTYSPGYRFPCDPYASVIPPRYCWLWRQEFVEGDEADKTLTVYTQTFLYRLQQKEYCV